MMNELFGNSKRIKTAFHAVKVDMDLTNDRHEELKQSVNDWIIFLDKENRDLKMRILELENKLGKADESADEEQLSVLRSI